MKQNTNRRQTDEVIRRLEIETRRNRRVNNQKGLVEKLGHVGAFYEFILNIEKIRNSVLYEFILLQLLKFSKKS